MFHGNLHAIDTQQISVSYVFRVCLDFVFFLYLGVLLT